MDEQNGRYKTLSNGSVYDLEKKRLVRGPSLTSDQARALVQKREEKKRTIMREVANQAVQNKDYRVRYGGEAWLAAITEAAMIKATTPDDPKMIESARFVMQEMGESAQQQAESSTAIPLSDLRGLLREIADTARALAESRESE